MLRGVNGSGGGAPVGGSGTTNTIPRWTGASTLGDSGITQSGSFIGIGLGAAAPLATVHTLNAVGTIGASPNWMSSFDTSGNYRSGLAFAFSVTPSASKVAVQVSSNGTGGVVNALVAQGDGNVGIGTASPGARLEIPFSGTAAGCRIQFAAGPFNYFNATNHYFRTLGDADVMTIVSTNVGIGTTSPASALHVRNNTAGITLDSTLGGGRQYQLNPLRTGLSNSGFEIRDVTAGTGVLWFDATQQVGIGTPTPASRLDVAGTITCDDAGTGLKLPATPGNADTQTLDAYAEGTYTPTTTGFGGTVSSATGAYTRIGRMVFCEVLLNGTAMTATYGTAIVSAPFTIAAGCTSTVQGQSPVGYGIGATSPSSTQLYVPTMASASTMRFTCTYFV